MIVKVPKMEPYISQVLILIKMPLFAVAKSVFYAQ